MNQVNPHIKETSIFGIDCYHAIEREPEGWPVITRERERKRMPIACASILQPEMIRGRRRGSDEDSMALDKC